MARRGTAFLNVNPNCSSISIFSGVVPGGSFQLKDWRIEANIKWIIRMANGMPGHILRPAPNGIYAKSRPLESKLEFKNLSGENEEGSSQCLGSLPMAQTFTSTWVFFGTTKPCNSTSFLALWGKRRGAAGWSLIVSFTTAWRYGRRSMSDSCICRSAPMVPMISFLALSRTSGFRSSSAIAHSVVIADVFAAINKSCNLIVKKN